MSLQVRFRAEIEALRASIGQTLPLLHRRHEEVAADAREFADDVLVAFRELQRAAEKSASASAVIGTKAADLTRQLEVLRRLIADDITLDERNFFKKEIKDKLDGYARQDKENGIQGPDLSAIISLDATIELLLVSKMRCTYCRECCELIYKDVMAPRQWTLDRVDNDQGHSGDNVVLACLACNLQRRTMDAERFKFGKQLRIVKGF
jgi:RNase P subunit RPR2